MSLMTAFNSFVGELVKSKKVYNPDWKFDELNYTYMLYSSTTLANMLSEATKAKNGKHIVYIMAHIDRHRCRGIESYDFVYEDCVDVLKRFERRGLI